MSRAWKCSSQARVWMRWLWDGVLVDRSTGRRPKRLGPGRRGPVGGGRSTGRVTGRRQNSTDRHLLPSDALLSKHAMSRHFPPEALSLSFFVRWSVWFVFFWSRIIPFWILLNNPKTEGPVISGFFVRFLVILWGLREGLVTRKLLSELRGSSVL